MYMFYKNLILVLPVWTVGWFSLFSGAMIYNNALLQLYNLAFTAIPIMWYAIFDWEHDKQTFLDQPKLYAIGMHDVYFNWFAFWRWFGYAFWQGIVIAIIVLSTFNFAQLIDGQQGGIYIEGNYMFYVVIIVVNIKVLISSFQYTFWMLFWIIASVLFYYACFILVSFTYPRGNYYGDLEQ